MSDTLVCPNCGEVDDALMKSIAAMPTNTADETLRASAATIVANYNDPTLFNRSYWRRRLIELVLLGLQSEANAQ